MTKTPYDADTPLFSKIMRETGTVPEAIHPKARWLHFPGTRWPGRGTVQLQGGWGIPDGERYYDGVEQFIPEITAERGGLTFTKGPDL